MSYWRERHKERQKEQRSKYLFLMLALSTLMVGLGISSYYLNRLQYEADQTQSYEDESENLTLLSMDEVVSKLTYNNPHDIPYLDEIFKRGSAVAWAGRHIGSGFEEENYLSLLIYQKVPKAKELGLSLDRFEKVQQLLTNDSSAIRIYAATTLLTYEDASGMDVLLAVLDSDRPLTFMEPVMLEKDYARQILEFYFGQSFGADAAAWRAWWGEHRIDFLNYYQG